MLNNSLTRVSQVKLTAVHLIRTMLTRIGSTAATAQWHAAVGARPLCGLHHLFVLGASVLEPDFHLKQQAKEKKKKDFSKRREITIMAIDNR